MSLENLGQDTVIKLEQKLNSPRCGSMFTVRDGTKSVCESLGGPDNQVMWRNDGVPCQVLAPGGEWRKGKVKVTLQFEPEE